MPDGASQLRMLARDLDKASKEVRRDSLAALRRTAKPLIEEIRQEARDTLPKRGGLNEYVAAAGISTQIRTGANTAGVRIVGKRKQTRQGGQLVDLPAINRGRLRHPTYGHGPWVTQQVNPGFWDGPVERHANVVAQEMRQVMDDIARRLERG